MCGSESKAEMMKPLLIKAGIPAALSALAYICVKIISKPSDSSTKPLIEESEPLLDEECDDNAETEPVNLEDRLLEHEGNLLSKLLDLEAKLEEVQVREWDTETRFLRYQMMKEKELMLVEMRNAIKVERTQAEFLLKEVSSMEDECKRIGELVIEFMKLVEQVKCVKEENRSLGNQVMEQWRLLKEQELNIKSKDEELLRSGNYIKELEDEIGKLKMGFELLEKENLELLNNKTEEEMVTREDYDKIQKQLQLLQQAEKDEANEITYLKWSNACLRHQLMKYHEHLDHTYDETGPTTTQGLDQTDSNWAHSDEPCSGAGPVVVVGHRAGSRRRRIIQKFKRWVDGSGKIMDDDNTKCFGSHDGNVDDDGQFVQSRKSCSSV